MLRPDPSFLDPSFLLSTVPHSFIRRTPLTYLYIKLSFVELIKIVIINIRIYKDIIQGKLVARRSID